MTDPGTATHHDDLRDWQERARRLGLSEGYYNIWGQYQTVPLEGLRALVAAAGSPAKQDHQALPACLVLWSDRAPWRLQLADDPSVPSACRWTLTEESGQCHAGNSEDGVIGMPADLPLGYHRLEVTRGSSSTHSLLIRAPGRCHTGDTPSMPPARHWGPSLQLYALRSGRNWGMGDFTDLVSLMPLVAQAGAAMVGLNPLHALYPHNPEHASPYSPSSRLFGNSLYLDVEAIPEFAGSLKARQQVADPGFQAELIRLRGLDQVDYTGVSRLKMAVLETLHAQFLQSSQDDPGGDRARAYASFCHDHGTALYRHALFEAIQEHLFASDPSVWGWPAWPTAFHDPDGAAVARFAAEHPDRIGFYQYLQWEFSRQLMAVQASAREAGMPIGLYLDLAVSIDAGGAEAWSQQDLYAAAASAGCPPDDFNLNGQDWGLLPAIPQRLLETGFASFIAVLRAAMSGAGAVRLDHVMGLARLFWVPRGKPGTLGTYMTYPFEPLMAIVTLESQRHRCLVIGEDLGTVSDEVRISMQMSQTLSYRVLYFSFEGADHLLPPEAFPADALVTCTTHDLATLPGYWLSRDLEWRERLNLFPQPDMIGAQRDARDHQKQALLTALVQAGLWNGPDSAIMVPDPSFELVVAVYSYLARSPARLMAVQPEDVFGCLDQVNLPGTVTEYDNWRRRLPVPLEAWQRDGRFVTLGQAIARQGRGNDLTG